MKQVIIIGGGFCGTHAAQQLENDYNTTLIDNKDYFEFTPGILRTIVQPTHAASIQALHKDYLKKTTVIKGNVTSVTQNTVFIRNKKIKFDYLIIASGSTYNLPIKAENIVLSTRAKVLQEYHKELDNATNILIIGGGIVGVELAAEIVTHYNNKNVTIVHAGQQLMNRQPQKARIYAEKFLTKNNVKIHFNELVMEQKNKTYYTDKGNALTPDIAFLCTGIVPNTEFMKKDLLNDRKQIIVNEHLQVNDYKNIFAGGDANSIAEEKTAQNAQEHAKIIVNNIKNIENKKPLEKYVSCKRTMVISLGTKHGILTYKNIVIKGRIPGMLKNIIEKREMQKYR